MKVLTALFPTIVLLSLTVTPNLQSQTNSQRGTPVAIGDIAPDFALEDQNRDRVTLSNARGKSPVVVIFYRGYW